MRSGLTRSISDPQSRERGIEVAFEDAPGLIEQFVVAIAIIEDGLARVLRI
jgi:hypothetical protein